MSVIKLYITKATDLWKTIVNLHDFYSLNLWKILLGGLGWSSRTVKSLVLRKCKKDLKIPKIILVPVFCPLKTENAGVPIGFRLKLFQ